MKQILCIALVLVTRMASADADANRTCNNPNYDSRANECAIEKTDESIARCCEHSGAVFCGEDKCVCYRRAAKTSRLKQTSGKNQCDLLKTSPPPAKKVIQENTSESTK